ncbi:MULTISPECIES: ABC transporter permease [Bacillus cereus group]|uniref:ABC transporter permease n=2 Tax=Bacillus thuringiensis TaxID=1428 RepID=A0A9X6Y920_BACTU|nr:MULTISPECIES: ABC transporter permease [Bacillus cereus group]MCU5103468.1 ABC transporter permease [Bacillus cereus]MCU5237186.1 ABC transporter permease [Bacillus cereus]MCU5539740.1 ABC transporter permease [Bacillus cereus]PDZ00327.1 ABC transporter permease [Bacillus thuringiensis]PEA87782.1 ABC transporter permease [Bacillus thuringiensis]
MTLFDIVQRNIWRNFKEYILYFVSLTMSMVIYFIFASLRYSAQIKEVMINNVVVNSILQSSKVILILFIAIFIIYSTNFFMRKRKKEVGLYSLLGITKKQISTMLFWETIIMGSIALVIGVLMGSLGSKLALELLTNLMKLNVAIYFEFSIKALIDTSVLFLAILLYTAWKSSRVIYQFSLIEMFQADHKGESIPKGSKILAYMSIILLGIGYVLAFYFHEVVKFVKRPMEDPVYVPVIILIAIVLGTYFLFSSYTVIVLKKMRSKKNILYNGMNILNISQLLYRVKGNAKLLAIIALLSAVALTAISTVVSGYFGGQLEAKSEAPYSFSYKKQEDAIEKHIQTVFEENKKKNSIIRDFEVEMVTVKGGPFEEKGNTNLPNPPSKIPYDFQLMSQSMLNRNAKNMGVKKVNLNPGEVFIYNLHEDKNFEKGNRLQLPLKVEPETSVIQDVKIRKLTNLGDLVVIVPDQLYETIKQTHQPYVVRNIDVRQQKDSEKLTEELLKILPKDNDMKIGSFYKAYVDIMDMTGLMLFVGIFLGAVFVLETGSIIYYKQLSEAYANHRYYKTLRKIGVTKKEVRKSISKQVRFSFILPVIIGLSHSLFAVPILTNMPIYTIMIPILIGGGVYSIIYFGYYVLTVYSYFKIVYK